MTDELLEYRPDKVIIDLYDIDKTIAGIDFKAMRLKRGISLRDLSCETDISDPYLSQLENRKVKNPSFRVVLKLLKFYKVQYA